MTVTKFSYQRSYQKTDLLTGTQNLVRSEVRTKLAFFAVHALPVHRQIAAFHC